MNGPQQPERDGPAQDRTERAQLDQEQLELAALYALSALSGSEMEAVERDHQGRTAFWDEVRSLRDAAAGLAETGPRSKPRRDLWPAIRARVAPAASAARADTAPGAPAGDGTGALAGNMTGALAGNMIVPPQVWKQWRADHPRDELVVNADESAFEPTDIDGIRVRRLFVDEHADRITMLIRMEAGTSYPAHRHAGVEECFVIQGDLEIGDAADAKARSRVIEMHAGDFQRMDTDSTHGVQSTRGGCLLLITSSQHDELLG